MKKELLDDQLKMIEIKLEDGSIIEGEILFFYEENGDTYVLYEANEQVFGAKMKEDNSLIPIIEDEWPIIERIYQMWLDEEEE